MTAQYGDFQFEIYEAGTRGILPRYPVDADSLARKGAEVMPEWILSYVAGGCGDEHTQRANVAAFDRWGIVPRMFNGSHERDLSIELFGMRLPTPLFTVPIGVIGVCSRDGHGDLSVARAAARTGVPPVQSTLSTDPVEVLGPALGRTPGLFQLYTPKDRDLALSLIRRAEAAGYKAIVVTLDTWVTGWRPRDLNTANFPQLRGMCLANYFTDERFRALLGAAPEDDPTAAAALWAAQFGNSLTWDDLSWIREATSLPVVLKGICHPDDARKAVDLGADGIYCSNHGGRQANGGIPALDLLPGIVAAVDGVPVLFDSGVRSGTDVVKALALGATAVGVGRSYAYALALGGTDGLVHYLRSVLAEADLLMAIDGYPAISDLRRDGAVRRVSLSTTKQEENAMTAVRVAAVQAEPRWLNIDEGVQQVASLIGEAAAGGARLVAFPEVFIPGYPWWIWLDSPAWGMQFVPRYLQNSMTRDGAHLAAIAQAAAEHAVFVVVGFAERAGGSVYMAQAIIGDDGKILGVRRKLKPTHVERSVFGDGSGIDVLVVDTPLGKLGALNCAEHNQPLTKYAMYSMGEQLHVASWPSFSVYRGAAELLGPEVNTGASRQYAVEGGTFVMAPTALIGTAGQQLFCDSDAKRELLRLGGGYTRIYGPDGSELAPPLPETEEGILYADLDFDLIDVAKNAYDPVGHYSRPDIFRLLFNAEPTPHVQRTGSDSTHRSALFSETPDHQQEDADRVEVHESPPDTH